MNPDKTVRANNVPTATGADYSRGQLAHDQIAERAKKLWQERNQPSGKDEQIWFEAEAQLKAEAESKPVSGTDARPLTNEPATQLKSRTKVQDPADSAVQTQRGGKDRTTPPPGHRLRNQ